MTLGQKAIELAKALAAFAHDGQKDKAGNDYILHPLAVAARMKTPEETITALLHDVLEDTRIKESTILDLFGQDVLDAVKAVTKRPNEDYMDFVKRAKENPIARKVKMADLEHNMELSRLSVITKENLERLDKYMKAYRFLASDASL